MTRHRTICSPTQRSSRPSCVRDSPTSRPSRRRRPRRRLVPAPTSALQSCRHLRRPLLMKWRMTRTVRRAQAWRMRRRARNRFTDPHPTQLRPRPCSSPHASCLVGRPAASSPRRPRTPSSSAAPAPQGSSCRPRTRRSEGRGRHPSRRAPPLAPCAWRTPRAARAWRCAAWARCVSSCRCGPDSQHWPAGGRSATAATSRSAGLMSRSSRAFSSRRRWGLWGAAPWPQAVPSLAYPVYSPPPPLIPGAHGRPRGAARRGLERTRAAGVCRQRARGRAGSCSPAPHPRRSLCN